MEQKTKTRRIGQVLKGDDKKTGAEYKYIKLGQSKNKDPKYNYKVQLRILDSEGMVILKLEDPKIWIKPKHDGAPDFILNDLTVTIPE